MTSASQQARPSGVPAGRWVINGTVHLVTNACLVTHFANERPLTVPPIDTGYLRYPKCKRSTGIHQRNRMQFDEIRAVRIIALPRACGRAKHAVPAVVSTWPVSNAEHANKRGSCAAAT